MKLSSKEKSKVVSCCNGNLISDDSFDPSTEYPSQWFSRQFDFIDNEKLRNRLGEEFYQTRFAYTLMQALSLRQYKYRGIVKFQIIQYASICEALLNYTLDLYFKDEFENKYAAETYTTCTSALSTKTKITFDGTTLFLCKPKKEKAKITWTSNPTKAEFALEKGIISEDTKKKYCDLYDLRNNAHILKAVAADYYPKLREAKDAYELMFQFITDVRAFFATNPRTT